MPLPLGPICNKEHLKAKADAGRHAAHNLRNGHHLCCGTCVPECTRNARSYNYEANYVVNFILRLLSNFAWWAAANGPTQFHGFAVQLTLHNTHMFGQGLLCCMHVNAPCVNHHHALKKHTLCRRKRAKRQKQHIHSHRIRMKERALITNRTSMWAPFASNFSLRVSPEMSCSPSPMSYRKCLCMTGETLRIQPKMLLGGPGSLGEQSKKNIWPGSVSTTSSNIPKAGTQTKWRHVFILGMSWMLTIIINVQFYWLRSLPCGLAR